MKTCSKCQLSKSDDQFHKCKTRPDGLHPYCKECRHTLYKVRYAQVLFEKYGKTYAELYEKQGGVCAICGCAEDSMGRDFSMDHDHTTGKLRGLLCTKCNLGISSFDENIVSLKQAINYLESKGVYCE